MDNSFHTLLKADGVVLYFDDGVFLVETGRFYCKPHNTKTKTNLVHVDSVRGYAIMFDVTGDSMFHIVKNEPNGTTYSYGLSSFTECHFYICQNILHIGTPLSPTGDHILKKRIYGFTVTNPELLQYRCNYNVTSQSAFLFKHFNTQIFPDVLANLSHLNPLDAINLFVDPKYWNVAIVDITQYTLEEKRNFLATTFTPEQIDTYLSTNSKEARAVIAESIFLATQTS